MLGCLLLGFALLAAQVPAAQTVVPAAATPSRAAAAIASGSKAPSETLAIFNRKIFEFRASFLGISPEERARVATERILEALDAGGVLETSVEAAPQGAIVRLGGTLAFVVTPGDTGEPDPAVTLEAARRAARSLDRVIAETREARDLHALAVAGGHALVATAILLLVLWGLARLRGAVERRIVREAAERTERMRVGGVRILEGDRVLVWARRCVGLVFWIALLLAVYQWLGYVLARFPYTRPWGERLTEFLIDVFQTILVGIAQAIPGLVIAVVIFLLARGLARVVDAFLQRVQAGRVQVGWLDADTARPTRRLAVIVIWAFALAMAYPYLPGSDTDAFRGLSVLIGLMVSLGASNVIGQGASGIILMYTRALRPGEYVRVGEHEGTVVELTMFATRIRTGMGVELTLPSALVLGAVTMNYSRTGFGEGFVAEVKVTIGYDTPWRQVHAMLLEAAAATPDVLREPRPRVYQLALSDFYVEYTLVCYGAPTAARPRVELISHVHAQVLDVFNKYGVQIMSPGYEGDPDAPKIVPPERWFEAPARDTPATTALK